MNSKLYLFLLLLLPFSPSAQTLPLEGEIENGRLRFGANPNQGFYDINDVHKLEITLTESNWLTLLDGSGGPRGGTPGVTLVGKLTFNDTLVLDSVLVSIKGQTSDSRNNSEKKSFKIEIDELIDQKLMGYDNLNLNCAYEDHSGMREVLYYDISKPFAPALKGSFVDLYINGTYWGPYNNIQQIEGTYISEWFFDNDGTRWRAVAPDGVETDPRNRFGQGVSTLNYNGPDSSDYNENYTLKKTTKDNPWEDLIEACYELNNLPIADLYDSLKYIIDVDRALWFLAQEIVFSDDDSYINKGGMDYYVYWDITTDRIIPMEVDGNSVLSSRNITWGPFYNEDETDFPLLNRVLANTEMRQRYLAHLRTVLDEHFTEKEVHDRIDEFAAILDQRVKDDPKKIYSYTEFTAGVQSLKTLITSRINTLSSHTEVNREGVLISDLEMESDAGKGIAPEAKEAVQVTVKIAGDEKKVVLYYGTGLDGVFERTEMFDDGMHGDGAANDDVYGDEIPGQAANSYVRYYVEAIKDDAFSTSSFHPRGAEHDVFIYQVQQAPILAGDVVINEFMADNETSIADQAGEFDDWIELHNTSSQHVDLSGYYLTDNEGDLTKWVFPEGSRIWAGGYLIIWADNDLDQTANGEYHANFKLSAGGEEILLVNSSMDILDTVFYEEQDADKSFARKPNGSGPFEKSEESFGVNNDDGSVGVGPNVEMDFAIYPNPAKNTLHVKIQGGELDDINLSMHTTTGQKVFSEQISTVDTVDISGLKTGVYFVSISDNSGRYSLQKRLIILD